MVASLKNQDNNKKEQLKRLLMEIHKGRNVNELKSQFKELLQSISPLEIPLIEQELIKEGISAREIAKMCDIHVELFRETVIDKGKFGDIPLGHPLHTLLKENEMIIRDSEVINLYVNALANTKNEAKRREILDYLRELASDLTKVGKHYAKDEMLIFPYIERRGITAVPRVLWTKFDEARFKIKVFKEIIFKEPDNWDSFIDELKNKVGDLTRFLVDIVFRENNILYPTLKILLSEGEWVAIRDQMEEIGFYKVTPKDKWMPTAKPLHPYQITPEMSSEQISKLPNEIQAILNMQKEIEKDTTQIIREGDLVFDTGYPSLKELKAIFKNLPFSITFIDKDDRLRFFSEGKERIFVRTKSVIGRPVQLCHPPRSVHIVKRILKEFREGTKDSADFWIKINGRLIYIQYFPVRDENGEYIGTLEVTQDVTELKKLEGEKRLLAWT